MTPPYLTIVIPAYNEETNFRTGVLNPTLNYLQRQTYTWEIIFVDDGSTDMTNKLLVNLCNDVQKCKLIKIIHGGRGAAYQTGILAAKGKFILYTDFDQSTPIVELDKFWPEIEKGADIVIGSRGMGNNTKRVDSLFNIIRANAFIVLGNLFFGFNFKDLNCGFKLYRNEVAKKIFSSWIVNRPQNIKGAFMGAVDVEILHLALKNHFKVTEIPVNWYRRPTHGSFWREPLFVFRDFMKIKILDLQGKY